MKRPQVTPIFPRSNGLKCPENLPIRRMDSREHILKSGGFGSFNPLSTHHIIDNIASPNFNNSSSSLNCITIAQHIDNCPICSRLYDTDKTLYILAIIGLLILCFLMVKRIIKI